MPARSKIHTCLSEELRAELDRKLVTGGFADYRGLSAWLGDQGLEISVGAVQRYGAQLEERIAQINASTQAAEALVAATPDNTGAMADAALRIVQQRMVDLLMAAEEDDVQKLSRAATALAKVANAQTLVRAQRHKILSEGAQRMEQTAKRAGISPELAAKLRARVEGSEEAEA